MRCAIATLAFGLLVSSGFGYAQSGSEQVTYGGQESRRQYFPPGIFGQSAYKKSWYASFLVAMREPSLLETARNDQTTEYRLLLVLSDRALSFRLELLVDGTGELAVARAIPQGGKLDGVLIKSGVPVTTDVRAFLALLQRADFWKPETEETPDKTRHEKDGIRWVLEGVRNGEHHVVDRSTPRATDFAQICIFLMKLTPMNLEEGAQNGPTNGQLPGSQQTGKVPWSIGDEYSPTTCRFPTTARAGHELFAVAGSDSRARLSQSAWKSS